MARLYDLGHDGVKAPSASNMHLLHTRHKTNRNPVKTATTASNGIREAATTSVKL